ncbi:MAG: crossover junction endodeoxyribonuclease RuvC [Candidatus Omnitrophica bacterium]|nr:crossover junction endodeoxyribonuclease RuvC [Candidatus Omnitrophota bacterium]MDE2008655.1 crossover junction endodeoxyribonuclease RuvC [Candidatus Omnitrophota bacterium]MDE2214962.1 crossover junction endodeoxyribonuclease RuvC [Candidatus Omnitrophota bacterium]MDE2230901.1 crossover junction endodeoxyribonuclease RuvC [Candidatus Omnitrophota bacterium]
MRILGVDPGLVTTGYGVVDLENGGVRVLEAGTIEPESKDLFERRLLKVHLHITAILKAHHPDVVVLEKLYAHYKHPATAPVLGHVRGVICLSVAQQKIQLVEQSAKRIRQALMGNGNATKAQAQEFVKRVLNIKSPSFKLDASDALSLALGQAHMMRYKLI